MKKLLLLLLLSGCTLATFAQSKKKAAPKPNAAAPTFVTKVENITEYKLKNGMQVLLIPDATQNNVLVNIVYRVGSRNEGYGETGMAHLLEHMLFKGTQRITDIKKAIADKGAQANGTTWYDRTNYYEILPASDDNLKWALDMEADRMINSRIAAEDLAKEFSVVRNEFEAGENYPEQILEERILSTMFLWHNYGKSTIGSKEDIEKVPAERLKVFYKKYYQPDNATLIVAGKFDTEKTLAWIAQYFSTIEKPSRVIPPDYTVEPVQDGERMVSLRRNGDVQYIGAGFHTAPYAHPDFAANRALISILTNEPSGYLYKKLIETKKATKVYGYAQTLHDPGFSYFGVEVPKDKNVKEARKVLLDAFNSLDTLRFTQDDLTRAKNAIIKSEENLYNNTIYFGIRLTESIGAGDYRLWFLNRDRIEQLKLKDVNDVAHKYYKQSNRTYGVFTPDKNPDRTDVPAVPDIAGMVNNYKGKEVQAITETFEASIKNIKEKTVYGTLANGMRYAILHKPVKGNKIFATMMLKMGDEKSLSGKNLVSNLTARMLKYGTKSRSRKEISDELDKNKTSISFYGNTNTLYAGVNTDKEHFAAAMDLLQDMLLHPSFDEKEYDKLMLDVKADLENSMTDPMNVASETMTKKLNLYPKGHPYYPQTSKEQLADLGTVTLQEIKDFYKNFYGSNNGYMSFVGDVQAEDAKKALAANYGKWNSAQPYKDIKEKYFDVKGATEVIQIDDKTNATLMGGQNIALTQQDEDFVPLLMANEMLGGGAFLSSRIPQRLREAEGMSYGAGSWYSADYRYPSGSMGLYAIFNPSYQEKLNNALHEEINKAIEKGFTEEEWKSSLQSWLQQRKISLDENNYLVSMLNNYMFDGKDLNYYTDMEEKAKSLKLAQINAALKKYIDPDKMILIYAGDFKKKN